MWEVDRVSGFGWRLSFNEAFWQSSKAPVKRHGKFFYLFELFHLHWQQNFEDNQSKNPSVSLISFFNRGFAQIFQVLYFQRRFIGDFPFKISTPPSIRSLY